MTLNQMKRIVMGAWALGAVGCSGLPGTEAESVGQSQEPLNIPAHCTDDTQPNCTPNPYLFVQQTGFTTFTNCPSGYVLVGIEASTFAVCASAPGSSPVNCAAASAVGSNPNKWAYCPNQKWAWGYKMSDLSLNCCGAYLDDAGTNQTKWWVPDVGAPTGHIWKDIYNPAIGYVAEYGVCPNYTDAITAWNLYVADYRCSR